MRRYAFLPRTGVSDKVSHSIYIAIGLNTAAKHGNKIPFCEGPCRGTGHVDGCLLSSLLPLHIGIEISVNKLPTSHLLKKTTLPGGVDIWCS